MDKISIVVPVYNVEKYIVRNLKSLVKQTYKNIEIIVVNDGSPDNSQKIIDKFQKKYPDKIKSYIKENGGLSDARNYGIAKATGKFIMFIDSDDYVEKNIVEELYNSIKENKSDIAICDIYDDYEMINRSGIYKNYIPKSFCDIYTDKLQLLNRFCTWNKLFNIELFKDKNMLFAQNKIYEDLRLIPKLYLKANKISYVNKPLYHYIIREGSVMTSSNIVKNLDIISGFEDLIGYYKKEKKYSLFKDELEYLVVDHLYIAAQVRVIKMSKAKDIRKNIKPFLEYIENNNIDTKNNKYLTNLSKGKKLVLKLLNLHCYRLLKIILKLKK